MAVLEPVSFAEKSLAPPLSGPEGAGLNISVCIIELDFLPSVSHMIVKEAESASLLPLVVSRWAIPWGLLSSVAFRRGGNDLTSESTAKRCLHISTLWTPNCCQEKISSWLAH